MATELIQNFCDEFILYLLLERDEEHEIIRIIQEDEWSDEEDKELWVNDVLLPYLGNGLDYHRTSITGEKFIAGCDIRNWTERGTEKLKCSCILKELHKDEYDEEVSQLHKSLSFWRIESDGFFNSLLFNYLYRYMYDRLSEDLLELLQKIIEDNSIIPK